MNKFNTLRVFLICIIISPISCVFENTNKQSLVTNTQVTSAAEADLDIDFTPADEDIKCSADHECIITEKGCCFHEKPMAIRKDRSFEIVTGPKGIRAKCREFNQEQLKKPENANKPIKEITINCKGREAANWTAGLVAQCKKEEEKKYDEKAEGKCAINQIEAKAKELVEIWVKNPIAKISKILEYKYGETWGELKAKAAKLFGQEGLLIYSPGKTFLDTHIIKEEEMKSKPFIMFVPQ